MVLAWSPRGWRAGVSARPTATAFLRTHPTVTSAMKLPAQYATPGNYPTSYTISYDAAAKEYQVALGGFVARR